MTLHQPVGVTLHQHVCVTLHQHVGVTLHQPVGVTLHKPGLRKDQRKRERHGLRHPNLLKTELTGESLLMSYGPLGVQNTDDDDHDDDECLLVKCLYTECSSYNHDWSKY